MNAPAKNFDLLFSEKASRDWVKKINFLGLCGGPNDIQIELSKCTHNYQNEDNIYMNIQNLTCEIPQPEKNHFITQLRENPLVQSTNEDEEWTELIMKNGTDIRYQKLSTILQLITGPKLLHDPSQSTFEDLHTSARLGYCHSNSLKLSKFLHLLNIPNDVVTGYVYGLSEKAKNLHTWLEFKDMHLKGHVADYNMNAVMNIDGYNVLHHFEEITRINDSEVVSDHSKYDKILKSLDICDKVYCTFRHEIITDLERNLKKNKDESSMIKSA